MAIQLLPAAILLFNGLKRAYACRAEHENDEDDDDEDGEDDDDNGKVLLLLYSVWFIKFISLLLCRVKWFLRCSLNPE